DLPSRAAVDAAAEAGLAAGGTEARPPTDHGFVYQRQLTDPDGNVIEVGHMDPAFMPHGSDAAS
ncbi:VOC family protein, partial [Clavibacter michiganensis]